MTECYVLLQHDGGETSHVIAVRAVASGMEEQTLLALYETARQAYLEDDARPERRPMAVYWGREYTDGHNWPEIDTHSPEKMARWAMEHPSQRVEMHIIFENRDWGWFTITRHTIE